MWQLSLSNLTLYLKLPIQKTQIFDISIAKAINCIFPKKYERINFYSLYSRMCSVTVYYKKKEILLLYMELVVHVSSTQSGVLGDES